MAELQRLDLSAMSRAQAQATLKSVAEILAGLNEESAAWVEANIPKAARDGVTQAIIGLGVAETVEEAEKIVKFNRINKELVASAIADTQADLLAVTQNVERKVRAAVRQATADSFRANLAKGVNGRRTISRDILDQMRRTLGNAVNTGIIDSAGRRWLPQNYVEMVTRTKLMSAHRDATINEALSRDVLYGQISRHGAKDACRNWEGRIVKLVPDAPGDYPYIGDLNQREIFHRQTGGFAG
nr:phage minor capsid protein [Paenibacillus sp. CAA11]